MTNCQILLLVTGVALQGLAIGYYIGNYKVPSYRYQIEQLRRRWREAEDRYFDLRMDRMREQVKRYNRRWWQ